MYKQNYNRPGRVYIYPPGSTEVDLGELTIGRVYRALKSGEFTIALRRISPDLKLQTLNHIPNSGMQLYLPKCVT